MPAPNYGDAPKEAVAEAVQALVRAEIERAVARGIPVTYLDPAAI